MLSRKSNLPAVQASTALAVVAGSPAAIVAPGHVPKDVVKGIKMIILSFPSQGMADSDRPILQEAYLEAVAGFPRAVVEWTLKFLVLHNPRNTPTYTCPPTPQDVHEACKKTLSDWRRWVCDFYFAPPYGKRFGLPTSNELLLNPNAKSAPTEVAAKIKDFELGCGNALRGPKPGAAGCAVPEELQIIFVGDEIERQMRRIEEIDAQEQRGEIPRYGTSYIEILKMPDDAFECVPEAAFPDGTREAIKTKRAERAAAKRLAEELARVAEEERRLEIEREREELDQEITAIEAVNAQAQAAARQELSARWGDVFFVRPNSDTAWFCRQWLASLDRRGCVDLLDKIVMSEQEWQLAVPRKSPANAETELPVLVAYKPTQELLKRRLRL